VTKVVQKPEEVSVSTATQKAYNKRDYAHILEFPRRRTKPQVRVTCLGYMVQRTRVTEDIRTPLELEKPSVNGSRQCILHRVSNLSMRRLIDALTQEFSQFRWEATGVPVDVKM
jgi:hypothetical protein